MVGRPFCDQSSYTGCNLAFWSLGVAIVQISRLMTYMYRLIPKSPAWAIYLKRHVNVGLIPIYFASIFKKTSIL